MIEDRFGSGAGKRAVLPPTGSAAGAAGEATSATASEEPAAGAPVAASVAQPEPASLPKTPGETAARAGRPAPAAGVPGADDDPAAGATPLMAQYFEIKRRHPHGILLYRIGDFFETFFDDAVTVARDLNLTLTARDKHKDQPVPLAGFPHHASMNYIARLVAAGHEVVVCDQVEDPKTAKGIVRREVVKIYTPGTLAEPDLLDQASNNWLVAFGARQGRFVLASADLSTGELQVTEGESGAGLPLAEELLRLAPREVLVLAANAVPLPPAWLGNATMHERAIDDQEAVGALAAAFPDQPRARLLAMPVLKLRVLGLLVGFLADTQRRGLSHLRWPREYRLGDTMVLDEATLRNLELLPAGGERIPGGSLFELLDRTRTPMGARQLKRWLLQPLIDRAAIEARQALVAALVEQPLLRAEVRESLTGVNDLERLLSRILLGGRNPRDLAALVTGLARLPDLVALLAPTPLAPLAAELRPVPELVAAGRTRLRPELPPTLAEGGVIADGVDAGLDELRLLQRDGDQWLRRYEEEQKTASGLRSLKVRHNNVLGFYLEVSKAQADQAPLHFVRKQTLTNAERFITAELKDFETRVFSARDRAIALERQLFEDLVAMVQAAVAAIQADAAALARLDALAGLAEVAAERGFCRPVLTDGLELEVRAGRHPVVERFIDSGSFVPNDLRLDGERRRLAIITGPNMAGKSTYLRQSALLVLLAQIGGYVPAEAATIGVVDRIFTRVGASDNLIRGQSTFMVEMMETAAILQQATGRSLLILDEIGRGTSTFDGLALAWALVEHLHERVRARTLFATHYHELTDLSELFPGVFNLNVAVAHGPVRRVGDGASPQEPWASSSPATGVVALGVGMTSPAAPGAARRVAGAGGGRDERAEGGELVFLHRIEEGACSRSYGLEVARLAGVPVSVLERAREVLFELEKKEEAEVERFARIARGAAAADRRAGGRPTGGGAAPVQLSLFSVDDEVAATVREIDLDRLTPLEALNLLARLKAMAAGGSGGGAGRR